MKQVAGKYSYHSPLSTASVCSSVKLQLGSLHACMHTYVHAQINLIPTLGGKFTSCSQSWD